MRKESAAFDVGSSLAATAKKLCMFVYSFSIRIYIVTHHPAMRKWFLKKIFVERMVTV